MDPTSSTGGANPLDCSELLSSDGDHPLPEASLADFEKLMDDSDVSERVEVSVTADILPALTPKPVVESPGMLQGDEADEAVKSKAKEAEQPQLQKKLQKEPEAPVHKPQLGNEPPIFMPMVEQMQTPMLASYTSVIDGLAREFKQSALHQFLLAEKTLNAQHTAAMESQQMHYDNIIQQQRAQIEALQGSQKQLLHKTELLQKQQKKLVLVSQRSRIGALFRYTLEKIIASWRSATYAGKKVRIQCRLAMRHSEKRLLTVTCSLWRRKVHQAVAEKTEAHNRTAAELMRAKLIGEVGLERERMAAELERLRRQLSQEERHRVQLQENLKRVFMRGVCALNFEAMTLLTPPNADGALKENIVPPLNKVDLDFTNVETPQKTNTRAFPTNIYPGDAPGEATNTWALPPGDPKAESALPKVVHIGEAEIVHAAQEPSSKSAEPQEHGSDLPFIEAHESPRVNPPLPVAAPSNSSPSMELASLPYVNYEGPDSAGPGSRSSPAKSTASSSPAKSPAGAIPKERRWQTVTSGARPG